MKKEVIIIGAVFLAVFLLSGCSRKPTYEDGYDDGYADGQSEPLYPEDITAEYVTGDPGRYCGEYTKQKVSEYTEYLKDNLNCYEK